MSNPQTTPTAPQGGIAKILARGATHPDAIRYHVPRAPGAGGGWDPITWGQLRDRATDVALWLDARGIGRDDKVAVFATTRIEWTWVTPAIEACRAVFVPVYFSNTAEQVQYVVDHADARVLFTERSLLPRILERWDDYPKLEALVVWDLETRDQLAPLTEAHNLERGAALDPEAIAARTFTLAEVTAAGAATRALHPARIADLVSAITPDDLAAIIYTSGTTGVPKGVMLSNHNLSVSAGAWTEVLEHAFPAPGDRRDILWLPISHMSGWGIMGQGTMFDYETWLSDPWHLLDILPEVRPTMLFSVPAYWEKLYTLATHASPDPARQHAELRRLTGGALRFLLSGGAGLKREVKDFFKAAGIQMIEGYGMTEASPNLTMNSLDDYDFTSVGKPVPGVELKLADDGEILVRGENLFRGYYKMPAETRACYAPDGFFHTGDLGAWTEAHFLRIIGRKKEIIVTAAGKNIAPAGIESRFVGDPFIEHVVVYGDEHKYLVALLVPHEANLRAWARDQRLTPTSWAALLATPTVTSLLQRRVDAVNADLPSYETIKAFHVHPGHLSVEAGHLTPSLKLRRRKVWEAFATELEGLYR